MVYNIYICFVSNICIQLKRYMNKIFIGEPLGLLMNVLQYQFAFKRYTNKPWFMGIYLRS